jgi:4-alpha-glucanotransferase
MKDYKQLCELTDSLLDKVVAGEMNEKRANSALGYIKEETKQLRWIADYNQLPKELQNQPTMNSVCK